MSKSISDRKSTFLNVINIIERTMAFFQIKQKCSLLYFYWYW